MSASPPVTFAEVTAGARLGGVVPNGVVTVVALEVHGPDSATLTYRTAAGGLGERLISVADLATLAPAPTSRWTFDADGELFRLASEARRMRFAHLADPFAAVDVSSIEPYPHQIDAVYNRLLPQRPVRFVLADDPGAGKTIMSGLLIRELMLRGDVERCLIVAPGSLVEQWQDELADRFGLRFEVLSRATVEASYTGNPFAEKNLLIARLDQLARAEDLQARLRATEWDLVIVDEAHKMAAHSYGAELRRTKRFALGEMLRDRTRHLLLLTATPHNGKNEDFLAFLSLVHPDRFAGRLRGRPVPDVSDVMRRLVKENLRTFEGRRLFPRRSADSLKFELSEPEAGLYEAVTNYVRTGMAKAADMADSGAADRRRGIIIGFALAGLQRRLASSPAAIYHSLRRRCERLEAQAAELRRLAAGGAPVPVADLPRGVRLADLPRGVRLADLPRGVRLADLEDFDFDDYDDEEFERLEDFVIDAATAAATAEDLEAEVVELRGLVARADEVRSSATDTKWIELRKLLRTGGFGREASASGADGGAPQADRVLRAQGHARLRRRPCPRRVGPPRGGDRHPRRRQAPRPPGAAGTVPGGPDGAGAGGHRRRRRGREPAGRQHDGQLRPAGWNPNRIEQRFGRIHRIGQQRPCHLWNLVAHETREGRVFTRLFEKIEQQRGVYGDQVYDVLGDSHIGTSLRDLLLDAIRTDADPAHLAFMDEIIEGEIGGQLKAVLEERALVAGLADPAATETIRDLMERAKARKLQPWFVEAFFAAALRSYGGRIAGRERGRFEITRVPAAVRAHGRHGQGPGARPLRKGHLRQGPRAPRRRRGGRTDLTGHAAAERRGEQGAGRPRPHPGPGRHPRRPRRPVHRGAPAGVTSTTPSPTGTTPTAGARWCRAASSTSRSTGTATPATPAASPTSATGPSPTSSERFLTPTSMPPGSATPPNRRPATGPSSTSPGRTSRRPPPSRRPGSTRSARPSGNASNRRSATGTSAPSRSRHRNSPAAGPGSVPGVPEPVPTNSKPAWRAAASNSTWRPICTAARPTSSPPP